MKETSWARAMEADAATARAAAAAKNMVSRNLLGEFRDVKTG